MRAIFNRKHACPITPDAAGERRFGDAAKIAEALLARGRISLRVQGASMLPWVWPGDIAIIRRITTENARCGDVVLFRRKSRLFVHRVVDKKGGTGSARILCKGDAHAQPDGIVENHELLGRVVALYRRGRRIDLDAPLQLAFGAIWSQLSLNNGLWYPLARFVAVISRPVRRIRRGLRLTDATRTLKTESPQGLN